MSKYDIVNHWRDDVISITRHMIGDDVFLCLFFLDETGEKWGFHVYEQAVDPRCLDGNDIVDAQYSDDPERQGTKPTMPHTSAFDRFRSFGYDVNDYFEESHVNDKYVGWP